VLDRDYFRVSNAELRKIQSVMTVVDGRVVHDTDALDH
jgi:predicted amidohydrolase YtcJ